MSAHGKPATHSVDEVDNLEDPLSDLVDVTVHLLVLRKHKPGMWLVTGGVITLNRHSLAMTSVPRH